MKNPLHYYLSKFSLTEPELIANTQSAKVWKALSYDGSWVALKVYKHGTMGNEASGFDFLRAASKTFAARVVDTSEDAAVTEWLDGPSLGDLARTGHDTKAAEELGGIASGLHNQLGQVSPSMPKLVDWLSDFTSIPPNSLLSAEHKALLVVARELAMALTSKMQDVRPLHGDLHYENVRLCARGYCAFDAKGVIGPRAYELANAFRHPTDMPTLVRDNDRIRRVRDIWCQSLNVPPKVLMQWAVVKCALSITWRQTQNPGTDLEFDLLSNLIAVMNETN
ncbi:aminoglycoside phosphotransferase family protein [Cognatishimia sp.]|uniref:aminoglycoside phosphotransferase family protein n=1 Tax=Cognatishimia sp. TaxID=2211648 RepID=UPI003518D63C